MKFRKGPNFQQIKEKEINVKGQESKKELKSKLVQNVQQIKERE
jgi:hypothetical protein